MRKILLAFVFALVANLSAFAQNYTFSTTTGTYADLVSPTALTGTTPWADTIFLSVPIGFPFTFNGATATTLYLDNYGDAYMINTTAQTISGLYVFDTSLEDRGTTTSASPISYLLTGTAGSQILKIQWKNVGFTDGGTTDFANAQLWIYEGSNKVEMHYGSSSIASSTAIFSPYTGIASGLAFDINPSNFAASGLFLQGSPAAPTAVAAPTNTLNYAHLTGIPANGTVYTFTSSISGVAKELANASVTVYPNPATDVLHVNGLPASQEAASVKIYDVLGKVVLSETLAASQSVNISALKNGTYFMEITAGENRIGKNIIKQ